MLEQQPALSASQLAAKSSYFDSIASAWDIKPGRREIARAFALAISELVPLDPAMKVADYGCGTGLVAVMLQPDIGSLHGYDTSEGMLGQFRQKIDELKLQNIELKQLDLEKEEFSIRDYDLVFSAMTFHHVQKPAEVLAKISRALRPGGYAVVIDLDTEPGDFHQMENSGVKHFGFDRAEVKSWFEQAGLVKVTDQTAYTVNRSETGKKYPIFIVRGQKK